MDKVELGLSKSFCDNRTNKLIRLVLGAFGIPEMLITLVHAVQKNVYHYCVSKLCAPRVQHRAPKVHQHGPHSPLSSETTRERFGFASEGMPRRQCNQKLIEANEKSGEHIWQNQTDGNCRQKFAARCADEVGKFRETATLPAKSVPLGEPRARLLLQWKFPLMQPNKIDRMKNSPIYWGAVLGWTRQLGNSWGRCMPGRWDDGRVSQKVACAGNRFFRETRGFVFQCGQVNLAKNFDPTANSGRVLALPRDILCEGRRIC